MVVASALIEVLADSCSDLTGEDTKVLERAGNGDNLHRELGLTVERGVLRLGLCRQRRGRLRDSN